MIRTSGGRILAAGELWSEVPEIRLFACGPPRTWKRIIGTTMINNIWLICSTIDLLHTLLSYHSIVCALGSLGNKSLRYLFSLVPFYEDIGESLNKSCIHINDQVNESHDIKYIARQDRLL